MILMRFQQKNQLLFYFLWDFKGRLLFLILLLFNYFMLSCSNLFIFLYFVLLLKSLFLLILQWKYCLQFDLLVFKLLKSHNTVEECIFEDILIYFKVMHVKTLIYICNSKLDQFQLIKSFYHFIIRSQMRESSSKNKYTFELPFSMGESANLTWGELMQKNCKSLHKHFLK